MVKDAANIAQVAPVNRELVKAYHEKKLIFVFGSNLRGAHGAGAAAHAVTDWGAVMGRGVGHYGQSYALPTKDAAIKTLPIQHISKYVMDFIDYAKLHPELQFKVTRIGCGLAGWRDQDIAPMFEGSPDNCSFDTNWHATLGDAYRYWGHVA